jgi:tetratricopeptide (TPR) repeat protein
MEKLLENLEKYILYIVLGLLSIFVLSNYSVPYVVPKEILLVGGICLIVFIWAIRTIVKGSLTFSIGKFDLGVLLVALAYVASTFLATPNKMEAYLVPGTTTFILGGAVLYFLINQYNQKVKSGATIALFVSALLLSLISLFASLDVFSKIPQLPTMFKDATFNPMGGLVPSIMILSTLLVFSVGLILKEKDIIKKVFYGVSMFVIAFGVVVLISLSLPGKPQSPRFPTTQDSWEITVETLKKSPFVGVGPANYLTAFNLFRPVTYNRSDLWQVRFTTASNFYFTLVAETGFVGLFAIAVLLISIYKYVKQDLSLSKNNDKLSQNFEKLAIVLIVILFAVLPISSSVFVYLLALLAIISKSENKVLHLNTVAPAQGNSALVTRIPSIIVALPFIAGVIAVVFFGSKTLIAEATFKSSLDALTANDAKSTYDLMNKAITQNPRVDRYHANFAQVNMALANSLASKKDITDTDRTTISQLVQQAISEGKATVSLNPTRSNNWEVLAQIYRSVMPYAKGADQFAIQTYNQAIALDPTNPNLRIALGGIYYSLGKYDDAIDTFKLAVIAKPDLANSHYNLAVAYQEKKDYDNAITEINNVLNIVDKGSKDYTLAKNMLDELQKNKPAKSADTTTSESLTAPLPAQKSNIKPPITLPNEATPPASTNK